MACDYLDNKGHYNFSFPASTYDIKVQHIGYNTLIIRDADVMSGEVLEFNAMLGQGRDSSIYELKQDGSLIEIYQPTRTNKKN